MIVEELIAVCLMTQLLNGQTNWVVENPLTFYPSILTCGPASRGLGKKVLKDEADMGILAGVTCGCVTLEQANEFEIPFPKLVPEEEADRDRGNAI